MEGRQEALRVADAPLASEITERFKRFIKGRGGDGADARQGYLRDDDPQRRRSSLIGLTSRDRNGAASALAFLNRFELSGLFDEIITMEDAPAKPDPAPVMLALNRLKVTRAWMFGDTVDDISAARASGVISVGTLIPNEPNPLMTRQRLLEAGAARVIRDLDEILECIR